MNNTFNATSTLRDVSNSTACAVQIIGWCGFSEGAKAGIILGFIALFVVGCCCYCMSQQEEESDIYS